LIARPGQLISLRILMRQVWETNYVGDMRTIHVHISWLRKALGKERKTARSW
jgi:DNA-binding response OmpR family regulator